MKKSIKYGRGGLLAITAFLAVFVLSGCSENNQNIQPATSAQKSIQMQEKVEGEAISNEIDIDSESQAELPTEIKEETKTEKIAFETINQNNPSLEKGQVNTVQDGKEGLKELKYKVTFRNGAEINREFISENITVQPVNKIVSVGTKEKQAPVINSGSCGTDYYRNVDGNCVHRPDDNPSGATAKCRDGSYSYSQNRRGTCSHHGGVAQWL
jgi:hypothetical protein